ncbi:MAG: hypothetical protein HY690_01410 [Chloroflexi bacterium]|nr:hypothetical protein [Chloroflexota bacterium]
MDLKEYGAVVRRYWKLILGLTLAALVASTVFALRGPAAYRAEYTLAVSVAPEPRTGGQYFTYSSYYEWISSEYLADDLSKLIESDVFAEDVSAALGEPFEPGSVSQVTRVRKTHRMLDVIITAASAEMAARLAAAHEQVLNTRLPIYLAQLRADGGQVKIINRPRIGRASSPASLAAELGLRTLVGLLAGIGTAFLLNYLDGTIRGRREAEELLGTSVLGELPLGPGLA